MNILICLTTSQVWLKEVTVETRPSCQQEKIQYQIKLTVRDSITKATGCSWMTDFVIHLGCLVRLHLCLVTFMSLDGCFEFQQGEGVTWVNHIINLLLF